MDSLKPYVQIILKRLWLIALLVTVTVGGIYYTVASQPVHYQATVRLQALLVEPEDVALFTRVRQPTGDEAKVRIGVEFIDVLRNRDVAWDTASTLNDELGTSLTADDILEAMWPRIEGTTVIVVYRNLPSATLARRMAEVHIAKALAFYRSMRTRSVTATRIFLEKQVVEQQEAVNAARQQLRDFRLKYNLTDIDREATALQDQIRALMLERDRAQVAAEQAQALARAYRQEATRLRQQATTLAAAGQEDEATATQAQARSLEAEALAQDALAAGHRARVDEYDRLIAQYQTRLAELIGLQNEYQRLTLNIRMAEDQYAFLVDKLNEARTKEELALSSGYLQIIEGEREPVTRAPRPIARYVLYGAFVALLLGIVLALALEVVTHLLRRPVAASHPRQETL